MGLACYAVFTKQAARDGAYRALIIHFDPGRITVDLVNDVWKESPVSAVCNIKFSDVREVFRNLCFAVFQKQDDNTAQKEDKTSELVLCRGNSCCLRCLGRNVTVHGRF